MLSQSLHRPQTRAVAVIAVAALIAAACGGDDVATGPETPTATAAATTTSLQDPDATVSADQPTAASPADAEADPGESSATDEEADPGESSATDEEAVPADVAVDEPVLDENGSEPTDTETPATTVPDVETTEPGAEQLAPEREQDQPEPTIVSTDAPSLVADPVVVSEGSNTFMIEGSNFNPNLTVWLVLCALPGDSLSADTSADEIAAALESIERSHCDLGTAEVMRVDSGGSFTAQRNAHVIASFAWVASDADDTQAAGAAVFLEAPEPEVPAVTAAVEPISEPLTRCAPAGSPGATRVSVLAGTTADGFYEPVVTGGEDSCERIKAWWDEIRQAEADRIAGGQYPCEYAAAYNYWPLTNQTNGPAMLVGCWPRMLWPGANGIADKDPDPAAEAFRLWHREGFSILPPNHPAIVEALYGCYRDVLEGPPPGWTSPAGGEWPTVDFCNALFSSYGDPVRDMGVTPQCAADQIGGEVAERKTRGFVGEDLGYVIYAGDFSWANCSTSASRLLPEGLNTYSERCEAVIDASAGSATDQLADAADVGRDQVIAAVKAMFCNGTKTALRDHSRLYDVFVPHWTHPPYGNFVANWTPPEGSICYEAAMLVAAQKTVTGQWLRVLDC